MCIIEKRYFEKRTLCIIEESFDVQNRFSKSPQGDFIPEIAEIPRLLFLVQPPGGGRPQPGPRIFAGPSSPRFFCRLVQHLSRPRRPQAV
jgi:hypothetical protein